MNAEARVQMHRAAYERTSKWMFRAMALQIPGLLCLPFFPVVSIILNGTSVAWMLALFVRSSTHYRRYMAAHRAYLAERYGGAAE